jgi:hypothetical protein
MRNRDVLLLTTTALFYLAVLWIKPVHCGVFENDEKQFQSCKI